MQFFGKWEIRELFLRGG
jgi:hypothetical protein